MLFRSELNTPCRNLPQVHTIVRMMRLISEIVCPGILLLGEVVMEPEKVVPYFGTVEKPECHMLYNVTTMATTWHTVATRDVRLLKKQLDIVNSLPKDYVFLNYLRCHDDIGWGLDYATLSQEGIEERSHKKYLNDYFQGLRGRAIAVVFFIMRIRLQEMQDSVERQHPCVELRKPDLRRTKRL